MPLGKKYGGRAPGTPNKATIDARQAIASFVDGNAHRLVNWLDQVADGVRGEEGDYIVPPNPAKAFDMFQSVIEYHVPKLARHEHTGNDANPIVVEANVNVFGELLKAMQLAKQAE